MPSKKIYPSTTRPYFFQQIGTSKGNSSKSSNSSLRCLEACRLGSSGASIVSASSVQEEVGIVEACRQPQWLETIFFFFLIVDFVWTEICLGRFGDEEEEEEEHHRRHHQQHRHHHHCLRLRHRRHSDSDRNNKREFDRGCCLHPGVHGVIRWRIMRKLLVGQYKWLP